MTLAYNILINCQVSSRLQRRSTIGRGSRTSTNSLSLLGKQVLGALAGILSHECVHDNQRRHSLDNRDSTGGNTRIMTTLRLQDTLFTAVRSSGLRLADSSSGLERDAEVDGRAVGDTTLDTARVVSLGGEARAAGFRRVDDEGVVVD